MDSLRGYIGKIGFDVGSLSVCNNRVEEKNPLKVHFSVLTLQSIPSFLPFASSNSLSFAASVIFLVVIAIMTSNKAVTIDTTIPEVGSFTFCSQFLVFVSCVIEK